MSIKILVIIAILLSISLYSVYSLYTKILIIRPEFDEDTSWKLYLKDNTTNKIFEDIETLLSGKDASKQLQILHLNTQSNKYYLKKIVDDKFKNEDVKIHSDSKIIESLFDGKRGYIWLKYNYSITESKTKKVLLQSEGIDRIFIDSVLNNENLYTNKKEIRSSVEIPNINAPFFDLEKDIQ